MKKFKLRNKTISIKEGLTVLVGCNGIGKSTLITDIENYLDKKCIEYISFDNLNDGGSTARDNAIFRGDTKYLKQSLSISEGQNIVLNMKNQEDKIIKYIKNNKDNQNEFWFLFDSIDSGLSIDNIISIKENMFKPLLDMIEQQYQDKKAYIIVSANNYEMCVNSNCYNINKRKYVTFKNYNEYKSFILQTSKDLITTENKRIENNNKDRSQKDE